MANFYIQKVIASGRGKKDSSVEFTKGLNIIYGVSDTGKSCITKCINYIFGAGALPFDESTGYNKVKVIVCTPNGKVSFERVFGKNIIEVHSSDENIDSGKYSTTKSDNDISDVWLKLIGINEEHRIIKNEDYVRVRLTWRTMLHMFFVKETDIAQEESILLPKLGQNKTAFLSALLFLMTDNDFAEMDEGEMKNIKKARKAAIEKYINDDLVSLSNRREEIGHLLSAFNDIDIDDEVQQVVDSLAEIENKITYSVLTSKTLLSEILNKRESLAECDILLDRFKALQTQYVADVKRLSFIVDGEEHCKYIPQKDKCPFCNNEMSVDEHESYVEVSRAELVRIITQLNGLSEAVKSVLIDRNNIIEHINALDSRKSNIDDLISSQLQPKVEELKKSIANYRAILQMKNEMEILRRFADQRTTELRNMQNEEESQLKFKPKEHLGADFLRTIDEYIFEILEQCHYEELTSAQFSLDTFDVVVNGQRKATSRGQGYCAYLNTVLLLAMRKYLYEHGQYTHGLLIIDSPILPLEQGVSDMQNPESMKNGLFQYFLDHQEEGQLIIIENKIPKSIDYKGKDATLHYFTKGKTEGRYGFLDGVK